MRITHNHGKQIPREQFGNTSALLKQMAVVPVADGPLPGGFRVTSINQNSVLSNLGINQGDIISHINGKKVESLEQFLGALKSPPGDLVMISRKSSDGKISSIYLHL